MMQLPRGTFREIRKKVKIGDILHELERAEFSGICRISSEGDTGTLVYQSGTCILVKFHGKPGDPGWDELQKCRGEVDAALSTLDEAQVQLSLEFNKACRLVKAGTGGPSRKTPAHPPRHEPAKKAETPGHAAAPPSPARILPGSAPASPPSAVNVPPGKRSPAQDQQVPVPAGSRPLSGHPAPEVPPSPRAPDESTGPSDRDIDSLDIQDLENVTDKIRNDCKTMIKQLNLEHLMER